MRPAPPKADSPPAARVLFGTREDRAYPVSRSRVQYGGAQAQVPREHADELRFGPGQPDGSGVPENPDRETRDPELEANADCGGKRADGDRDRARRAAEQYRRGQETGPQRR